MKTPRFWYQSASHPFAKYLNPFSKIVILANRFRQKISQPKYFPIPIICCGNITVGGSGKTPIALEIAQILKRNHFSPHFLTRGYGRKKKQSHFKNLYISPTNPPSIDLKFFGDEALLLGRVAPCWIDSDRRKTALLASQMGADCLILDDGFQSPLLYKDLNLLLFNGQHAIGNTHILPAGPLREPLLDAIKRADYAIIVGEDRFKLSDRLKKSGLPTTHVSLAPSSTFLNQFLSEPVCAFAGIAFPEDFFKMLSQYGLKLVKTYVFSDHHIYTKSEVEKLLKIAKRFPLLTTEKDAMRFPEEIRKYFMIVKVKVIWHSAQKRDEIFQILLKKYKARMSQ
ncbi:tetraacyldisaccharide 4'-kinase [Acetobacteraceae bacterium]|nr:tetraacyldisaccharide 4'-kinase [Acetobacteraceae bacterium]